MDKLGQPKQHVPVFVGSTYEDLKEYRTAVRETLERLETIVRGMEYFGSKPGSPKEECLKAVRSSKVYIGIFAMRYGSIDEETGKSMTHLEYEEAVQQGLPILIYLIDEESQPILPKHVETGENANLLEELKNELKKKFTISFFTTPDNLAKKIAHDLPSVLSDSGVAVDLGPEESLPTDPEELFARFNARPLKYSGQEIIVKCSITGAVQAVSENGCEALGLTPGDAIKRRVTSEIFGKYQTILAVRNMADWLEDTPKDSDALLKITLRSGYYNSTYMSEDGPINKRRLVKGYELTEVLKDYTNQNNS